MVMLRPLPPPAKNARTVAAKSSGAASMVPYSIDWCVCAANCAWMNGERLWLTGWPMTA
jgi:hypothetical protein